MGCDLYDSPESVGVARTAVCALANDLGLEEPGLGDVRTVVGEACANVVRHAYPHGPGHFEIVGGSGGTEIRAELPLAAH